MNISIVEGDLLNQDVDVIVNAWNRNIIPWWVLLPQGVSGAIKRRGGKAPLREVGRHGAIPLGGAVLTCAGKRGRAPSAQRFLPTDSAEEPFKRIQEHTSTPQNL